MSDRFVTYARRSSDTEDRQTLSIEQQLDELRQFAFTKGFEVTTELTESCSARQPGRPVFGDLMKRVRKGEVHGILVWRLDRLARNMVDAGEIIYELTEGRLKEIVTPEATYTGTGDAKFMLAMLFGAAAKYTDDLSDAVRRGNRSVLETGKVPGPVPLGYIKTHEHERAPGSGTVIPDPERFEAVKRIWKEVLAGDTNVSDLWRRASGEWGLTTRPTKDMLARPVSLTNVHAILRNSFYAGKVRRGGLVYDGEHPPMVTWAQFQRVQDLIGTQHDDAKPHPAHDFLYQGLLHCGDCGRLLSGEEHIKDQGHRYVYYRCGRRRPGYYVCHAPAIPEQDVTDALASHLENVAVDPTIREWAFEAIAWWAGDDEPSPEKLVRRAKAALARAEHELETMTDMAVQDLLTVEEYKVRRTNQVAKIDHLREALAEPAEKLETWRTVREEMQQNGLKLGQKFREGDAEEKRRIVTRTCSSILVIDRKARIQLRTPFVPRPQTPDLQSGLPAA